MPIAENVTAYFLDSSAGVKLYATEPGSNRVIDVADPDHGHELFAAQITLVEIASALHRRARSGRTNVATALRAVTALRVDFASSFMIVEIGAALVDEAMVIAERHGLRGYDCLQLAAAVSVARSRRVAGYSPVVLVSADAELNLAAKAEGFAVENPNDYD